MKFKEIAKDVGATVAITAGFAGLEAAATAIGSAVLHETGTTDKFGDHTDGSAFKVGLFAASGAVGAAVLAPVPAYIASHATAATSDLANPRLAVAAVFGLVGTLASVAASPVSAMVGAAILYKAGYDVGDSGNAALAGVLGGGIGTGATVAAVALAAVGTVCVRACKGRSLWP